MRTTGAFIISSGDIVGGTSSLRLKTGYKQISLDRRFTTGRVLFISGKNYIRHKRKGNETE